MANFHGTPTGNKLLFTEGEWNAAMPKLVNEMKSYLRSFRTPIFKDKGTYGEGHGSGSFVEVAGAKYILTNCHVANVRHGGESLGFMFAGQETLFRMLGNHAEMELPWDLALLPVSEKAWNAVCHTSKCITIDQISLAHTPVSGEIFAFTGFAGDRTAFHFGTLLFEATCSLQREIDLPSGDSDWNSRFHFGLKYKPDLANSVDKSKGLPLPPGLSGSTVWNTCFVEAKMRGLDWTPSLAHVTGVVWGWDTSSGLLAATRAEHVRSFILGAPAAIAGAAPLSLGASRVDLHSGQVEAGA